MSYTKKAVHFGGGAIGRGFVAEFLHNSGYEVTFVDVDRKLVDNLNKIPSYVITEIGDDGERQFTIDHYKALHGIDDFATVVKAIAEADVVTCAVGPTILPRISKPVAEAIAVRELDYPLAVIACENAINATDNWRGFIEGHVKAEYLKDGKIPSDSSKARFANSAVDRIVPKQPEGFVLDVKIEKFYEWCVEEVPFENGGKKPEIKGVHFVKDLQPYIERKLFTVNTSHATAAYYGYNAGIGLIHEVLADKKIHDTIRAVVKETAHLISNKHKIDTKEQNDYVEAIIKRISNPALEDKVLRVGRAPLRKLSRKERFINPAAHLVEMGEKVDNLLGAIEMGFRFQNVEDDEESVELAKILKENSAEDVVTKVCGLKKDHGLYPQVVAVVKKVQAS